MENYTRLLEYLDENKTIHIRETFIQAFKKMGSSFGFDFWLIIIAITLFALTLTLPMYYWIVDKKYATFNQRSSFLPLVNTLSVFAILLVIANIFFRLTLDSGTIENQENKIVLDNLYSNTYIINKSEITDTDKEILDYLESVLQKEGDLNKLERISINNKKIMIIQKEIFREKRITRIIKVKNK